MSPKHEMPDGSAEDRLQRLFAAYRAACPDPEPGSMFMPQLWQRIDSRRSFAYSLKRLAQGIITVAAAASMVMAISLNSPHGNTPSYLELLAAGGQVHETLADTEIIQSLHDR